MYWLFSLLLYHNCFFSGMPGIPEIIGTPASSVSPGSYVRLTCRSYGTSPDTALLWYSKEGVVDNSYYVTDDYVINVYDLQITDIGSLDLECRLRFPPMDLEYTVETAIQVQGIDITCFIIV